MLLQVWFHNQLVLLKVHFAHVCIIFNYIFIYIYVTSMFPCFMFLFNMGVIPGVFIKIRFIWLFKCYCILLTVKIFSEICQIYIIYRTIMHILEQNNRQKIVLSKLLEPKLNEPLLSKKRIALCLRSWNPQNKT